jgi:cytochrome c oxidase subunit 4
MSERVVPPRTYWTVYVILIVLTFLTVGMGFLELGEWHTVVGLIIAFCKAGLVVLYFMHLLYGNRLSAVVAAGALFWLAILMILTVTDYLTRGWTTS